MTNISNLPTISIVIPTLNAAQVLEVCLKSLSEQDYPKELIEIIISDGGSVDATLSIAQKYNAKIVQNKLKTGESGKAIGVKAASGEYIALIDSDNILPTVNWLQEMVLPLMAHPEAVGSEPLSYTWRKEDGFIARYCALIGMNDPMVHFLGNYDRINLLTGKWTEVPNKEEDQGNYLLVTLSDLFLPTIGANGTVFRSSYLKSELVGDYLFDIDILAKTVKEKGGVKFIKVKNGIIHTFCESDVLKFARKQRRRVKDYLYHQASGHRNFDWSAFDISGSKSAGLIKFVLSCVTIVPLFVQAIKGYLIKPDLAWFFHPLACEITLWQYGWGRVEGLFSKSEAKRDGWKQ